MDDFDNAINKCIQRVAFAVDGRDAKEWALAAAVLIDKYNMPRPLPKSE